MKKFFEDFKAFAMRGNVIDMAVGVDHRRRVRLDHHVAGQRHLHAAHRRADRRHQLRRPVRRARRRISYVSAEAAAAAGVGTINYGLFIQNVVNFILTAFCMFLVIRAMNKVHKKPEPAPAKPKRICPFCKGEIADDATRCPHCTSMLE